MSLRQETWPVMRILMVTLLITCLVLINHGDQSNGLKKIKMIKKIKSALPFLLAMKKPKKKILLLPIPFPMKGKKGGAGGLGLLRGMSSLGNLMAGGNSWGSGMHGNYMNGGFMMPPSQPMMMMVPMPEPVYQQPAPVMNYPSQIDSLNNAMMNHAMDKWMMMAAMDCFGMDQQIQSNGKQSSNSGSNHDHWSGTSSGYDKTQVEERQPKQYFQSPAQVVREIPSKTVRRPQSGSINFNPRPADIVQQKQHHEEENFDEPAPQAVKSDKLASGFPVQQREPVNYSQGSSKGQQQTGGQTYFPIRDFSSGNPGPVKGGY